MNDIMALGTDDVRANNIEFLSLFYPRVESSAPFVTSFNELYVGRLLSLGRVLERLRCVYNWFRTFSVCSTSVPRGSSTFPGDQD
jgi:hypothetical protein